MEKSPTITFVLPCFNEAPTVTAVIAAIRANFCESASIVVVDNNSTDGTGSLAESCGAFVLNCGVQGKGAAMAMAFAELSADYVVMIDGDLTYDLSEIRNHVDYTCNKKIDMLIGCRGRNRDAYPIVHIFGNSLFTSVINLVTKNQFKDVLSGYRILSKRLYKSFPSFSKGYAIESELTYFAAQVRAKISEVDIIYLPRPAGSVSKLRTFRDGIIILSTILVLLKDGKPVQFFTILSVSALILSLSMFIPILIDYLNFHTVERLPTFIVSIFLAFFGIGSFLVGLLLDSVSRVHNYNLLCSFRRHGQ